MKFLHAVTLFATVGLALARDFFVALGVQATYPMIGALGLAVSTLLIFRGLLPIFAIAILLLMFALPVEVLATYSLDHDLLLATALTIVAYPWIRKIALG
jgi:hypothetical protein